MENEIMDFEGIQKLFNKNVMEITDIDDDGYYGGKAIKNALISYQANIELLLRIVKELNKIINELKE